jgi:hypothetical protein
MPEVPIEGRQLEQQLASNVYTLKAIQIGTVRPNKNDLAKGRKALLIWVKPPSAVLPFADKNLISCAALMSATSRR